MVRIYPVLVIKGTELEREYKRVNIFHWGIEQAVERCKEIIYLFRKKEYRCYKSRFAKYK